MAGRQCGVGGLRTALCAGLALALGACVAGPQVVPVLTVDGQPVAVAAPTDPYERGKAHLGDGQFGLALHAFRAALARDPGAVMALNGIAIVYDQLGRFELAQRYYERALALQPDAVETRSTTPATRRCGGARWRGRRRTSSRPAAWARTTPWCSPT